MVRLFIVLVFAFLVSPAVAQEWSVEVFDTNGAMGMGSLIDVSEEEVEDGWRYGLIATANHVVDSSTGIKVKYENGKSSSNCTVLSRDNQADIALIWCKVPDGLAPIGVGDSPIQEGDNLDFVGRFRRKFSGDASPLIFSDVAWSDVVVIPGDSGGAVILKGKLVGVISGGMQWAPNPPQRTWPCRTSNLESLKKMIKAANKTGRWRGEKQIKSPPAIQS